MTDRSEMQAYFALRGVPLLSDDDLAAINLLIRFVDFVRLEKREWELVYLDPWNRPPRPAR